MGLALFLRQIETAGKWRQDPLDAYIATVPKVEVGQRSLCVLPVVYRILGFCSSGPYAGLALLLRS